jgi:DNA-binding PadR family transcriptional regulator
VSGVGFFRYGELPLVLLALLQRRSMNGYEMLGELGRLFSPGYVPSPGSVYPAISALSRSGLIGAGDDNRKRRYQLTPAGGEALAMRQGQLSAIEARCGVYLHDHSEVEAELRRLEAALTPVNVSNRDVNYMALGISPHNAVEGREVPPFEQFTVERHARIRAIKAAEPRVSMLEFDKAN